MVGIYIYSIYPEGGFQAFYVITAILSVLFILALRMNYFDTINKAYNPVTSEKFTSQTKSEYLATLGYAKLGRLKIIIPAILIVLAFLCNFIPNKNAFIYIIATPYLVDGAKSAVDLLQDPTSKLYKINQLVDKGLDKALQELDKQPNKGQP